MDKLGMFCGFACFLPLFQRDPSGPEAMQWGLVIALVAVVIGLVFRKRPQARFGLALGCLGFCVLYAFLAHHYKFHWMNLFSSLAG